MSESYFKYAFKSRKLFFLRIVLLLTSLTIINSLVSQTVAFLAGAVLGPVAAFPHEMYVDFIEFLRGK